MAPTYLKIEEIGEPLGEIAERQTADVPCIIDVQLSQQRAVLGNAVNAVRFVFKWKRAFRVKRRQSGTLRKNRLEAGCLMVAVADGARTPDLDSVIADVQRRQMREAFADVSQAFRGENGGRGGQVKCSQVGALNYHILHATQRYSGPKSLRRRRVHDDSPRLHTDEIKRFQPRRNVVLYGLKNMVGHYACSVEVKRFDSVHRNLRGPDTNEGNSLYAVAIDANIYGTLSTEKSRIPPVRSTLVAKVTFPTVRAVVVEHSRVHDGRKFCHST